MCVESFVKHYYLTVYVYICTLENIILSVVACAHIPF